MLHNPHRSPSASRATKKSEANYFPPGLAKRRGAVAATIFFAILTVSTRMTAMPDSVSAFDKILPQTIDGWKKAGPPDLYTPANLSTYIDGGAELYISYGFQGAMALKYVDAAENEIAVDVFDMGTSFDAFGVFAHSRETIAAEVGQGSEYAAGLLTFWKDRYYVSILTYPETPAKKDVVFRLGRMIAGAIKEEGPLPPILSLLPAEGLVPEAVHYFHHYIWLNSFHFISDENVLDIDAATPAVLARYRRGEATWSLLIIRYPDAARAEAAAARFRREVLEGAADGMRLKDGKWMGLQSRGDLVRVVLGAPDAATVRGLFAELGK